MAQNRHSHAQQYRNSGKKNGEKTSKAHQRAPRRRGYRVSGSPETGRRTPWATGQDGFFGEWQQAWSTSTEAVMAHVTDDIEYWDVTLAEPIRGRPPTPTT